MTQNEIIIRKKKARDLIKEKASALSCEYKAGADSAIKKFITDSDFFKKAESVFIYLNTPAEPATNEIISAALKAGKRVSVPVCFEKGTMKAFEIFPDSTFSKNRYGIWEPNEQRAEVLPNEIDLAIIPCLSCTKDGIRLGHGAGYYDRFLAKGNMTKAVLCYVELISDELPCDRFDTAADFVITEETVYSRGM